MQFSSRVNRSTILKRDTSNIGKSSGFAEGLSLLGRVGSDIAARNFEQDEADKDSDFKIEEQEYKRRRAAHVAERAGGWALTQAEIATGLNDLRQKSKPGAEGYEQEAQDYIKGKLEAFSDTLNLDEEVQNRFEPLVQGYAAQAVLREEGWAAKARVEWQAENISTWQNQSVGQIFDNPTVENLERYFAEAELLFDNTDLDGNGRAAGKKSAKAEGVKTLLDGLIAQGDWRAADTILNSGYFDNYLDAGRNEKQTYNSRVRNAEGQEIRQAELAESRQRDDIRDSVKALQLRIDAGEIPDAKELRTIKSAAEAVGLDQSELVEISLMQEDAAINGAYQGYNAVSIQRDLNIIRGRMASGEATPEEQRSVQRLEKLLKSRNEQESGAYKELLQGGVDGRLQILQNLPREPETRFNQAESVEAGLGILSQLPPNTAKSALKGKELRAARSKDFGDTDDIRKGFDKAVGGLAPVLGPRFDDMMGVAWDIYAQVMNQAGATGYNEGIFKRAVNLAFGANVRSNGTLQGGIGLFRGKMVELPDAMTAPEFDANLSLMSWEGAVYADGRAASKADILAHYRPVFAGNDEKGWPQYMMIDAARAPLKEKAGNNFIVTVY